MQHFIINNFFFFKYSHPMVRKISKTKTAQQLHPPPQDGNSFSFSCVSVYINYSEFYNTT